MRVRYTSGLWILLLGACLGIIVDQAEAITMWGTCNTTVSSNFSLPYSGADYEAIGCRFSSSVTTVSMPSLSNDTSDDTSVLISGGSVDAGDSAGLWLILLPSASPFIDIPVAPLRLIVKDMSFGQDASFRLTGALPLRSSVQISNNTFYLTRQNLMNVNEYMVAIFIDTSTQLLDEGTTFAVLYNTVAARAPSVKVVAVNIVFQSLIIRGGSKFSVCGNVVENSEAFNAVVVYLNMVESGTFTLLDRGVFNVSCNQIRNLSFSSVACVAYIALDNCPLRVSNQSAIIASGNTMEYVAGAGAWVLYFAISPQSDKVVAVTGSFITMSNNGIFDSSIQNIVAVYWTIVSKSIVLDSHAALIISNNTILRSEASSLKVAQLDFTALISVVGNTSIDLSQNTVVGSAAAVSAYAVVLVIQYATRTDLSQSFLTVNSNYIISSRGNSVLGVVSISITSCDSVHLDSSSRIVLSNNYIRNCSTDHTALAVQFQLYCDLSITHFSSVSLSDNAIRDSNIGGALVVALVNIVQVLQTVNGYTLHTGSTLAVINNNLCNCNVGLKAQVVYIPSTITLSVRNNSIIDMANNSISDTNVTGDAFCVYLSMGSLSLENKSTLTVSGSAFVNSVAQSVYVVQLYFASSVVSISLLNQSNMSVSGNSFWYSSAQFLSSSVYCNIPGAVALHARSNIKLDGNNNAHSTTGSGGFNVVWLQLSRLSATEKSSVTMSGNTLWHSRSSGLAYVSYFNMIAAVAASNLTLDSQSKFVMNHNSMWNCSIASTAYAANIWLSGSNVSLSAQSTISMNGNSVQGCSMNFNAYVSLFNYVDFGDVATNLTLSGSSVITMSFNFADKLILPTVSLSLARIEASAIALTNSSLEFRNNSLTDVFTTELFCVEVVSSAGLSLSYSSVNVIGNTLSNVTTMVQLISMTDSPVSGESGTLNIDDNTVRPDSESKAYSLSPAVEFGVIHNVSRISITGNSIIHFSTLVYVSQLALMANSSLIVNGNELLTLNYLNPILATVLTFMPQSGARILITNNVVRVIAFRLMYLGNVVPMASQIEVSACGNYFRNELLVYPRSYFILPGKSLLQFTKCEQFSDTMTDRVSPSESYSDFSKSPVPSASDRTLSGSLNPKQTESVSRNITIRRNISLPVVASSNSGQPEVVLKVEVPPAATVTLSIISSSLGGAAAAVDSQVIAAVGLVQCARKAGGTSNGLRALSVVATDDSCQGVLIGNSIAIVVGALLCAASVLMARYIQVRRFTKSPVGSSPMLVHACAAVRAPQLLLILCAYLVNSYALCGLEVGGAGLIAFAFSIIIVASFPILTILFGARRLLPVSYNWRPRPLGTLGLVVFQSWALDPSIDSHKMFGCVFGGYRRLSCFWALTTHMSFIASLPMMLATAPSGTCVPLFALSSALFLFFSMLILVARPRRTTLADVLHSLTLLVNGLVLVDSTAVLNDPSYKNQSMLGDLGTLVTVLTVLRLVHSCSAIILGGLTQYGIVQGMSIDFGGVDVGSETLLHNGSTGSISRCRKHSTLFGMLRMPINTFEYCGRCWRLPLSSKDDDNASYAAPTLMTTLLLPSLRDEVIPICELELAPSKTIQIEPANSANSANSVARVRQPQLKENMELGSTQPQFLTEDEQFRREIAREYVRRQIEELLLL